MRIVFVTAAPPTPRRPRTYNLLTQLAPRHEVTVLCLCRTPREIVETGHLRALGARVVPLFEDRALLYGRVAHAALHGQPLATAHGAAPRLRDALRMEIARGGVDAVHVEGLSAAAAVLGLAIPVIWDAEACGSRELYLRAEHARNPLARRASALEASRRGAEEFLLLRRARTCTVATERDRLALLAAQEAHPSLRERAPARIEVIATSVDTDRYARVTGRRHEQRLVLPGAFADDAARQGTEWVLREVLPHIWQTHPDVQLTLAGGRVPRRLAKLVRDARITVSEAAVELQPYLAGAAVALLPHPYAVGVPTGLLEALALGTPVVATEAAAGGLRIVPGRDLLLASRADQYARQVVRLLDEPDLWQSLASNGRVLVERNHSAQMAAAQFEQVYAEVAGLAAALASVGYGTGYSTAAPRSQPLARPALGW